MPPVNGVNERRSSRIRKRFSRANTVQVRRDRATSRVTERTESVSQTLHCIPVSNVPVNSGNLTETVNVLTSTVAAMQQQLQQINNLMMYNTPRTDMTAANNTRETIPNNLQTDNASNNVQHG